MYVGSKGLTQDVLTGWNLTDTPELIVLIEQPDGTMITRGLLKAEFGNGATTGIVSVPILETDLTCAGVYHIQLKEENETLTRFSKVQTFSVALPLGAETCVTGLPNS